MKYATHNQDPINGSFGITVDYETMTWTTTPPGHDIREPMLGVYMSRGGLPGSGKAFDLFPGGKACLHK